MDCASSGERRVAKDREDLVEISQPDAAPGRSADELERVPKDGPTQVARDAAHVAGTKIETLEGLPTKDEHDGKQDEQNGNAERDARRRAFAQRENREPERAADHENENAGAREIKNDGRDEDGEAKDPDNPAFPAVPDVVLAAGEKDDRREAEKIRGLIAVRKRPEAAFVVPERKRGVGGMQGEAKRREKHDPGGECPQLRADFAQVEINRAHVIKPAQPGQETDETSETDPRLRRQRGGERDVEIIGQNETPRWLEEPTRRQKSSGGANDERNQDGVQGRAESEARRIHQQNQTQHSEDDAFTPFLGRASQETGENR